jgi:Glu-tRNA(Gln) amidotransferase subunit E-like FAD-binding protein
MDDFSSRFKKIDVGEFGFSEEVMKQFELERQKINNYTPYVSYMGIDTKNMTIPADEHKKKEKEYWEESLKILKSIETNTASLVTLVDLINQGNDEIAEIIRDLIELAKQKDKEQAESGFKRLMKRITDIQSSADTIIKLAGLAQTIYFALQQILT